MLTSARRRSVLAVLALLTVLVLAACGDASSSDEPTAAAPAPTTVATSDEATSTPSPSTSATTASTEPTDSPSPTAPPSPSPDPASLRVALADAGDGFDAPLHAFAWDGRTFVVEQVGRVVDLDTGEVWLDITDRVRSGGEQGLLGVDVHPDGGHAVVHHTGGDGQTVLATYLIEDGAPDVGSEEVVLTVAQPAANHNGGTVTFGPDGYAWLALGDGGAAGDRFGNGQDPGTLLGTLLRLDLDDPSTAVVPPGNPFADGDGGRPEVWAYGLRNPYRIAFGDEQVYIADVGQDAVEEVTVLRLDQAGANLGWPAVEGDRCFTDGCDLSAYEPADATYTHADTGGCSIIGGIVYEGEALPALRGHFLYADLCAGILRSMRAEGGDAVDSFDLTDQVGSVGGVTGIGTDASGEPLLTFQSGVVRRLVPAG